MTRDAVLGKQVFAFALSAIIPGMVAQVNILTGEKTVLAYLVQPVLRVAKNALHER